MNRPPRKPDERFFGPGKILFAVLKGLMLLSTVIAIYFLALYEGHSDGEVRAIAFSALITGNIFLILSSLSNTRNFIFVILENRITSYNVCYTKLLR